MGTCTSSVCRFWKCARFTTNQVQQWNRNISFISLDSLHALNYDVTEALRPFAPLCDPHDYETLINVPFYVFTQALLTLAHAGASGSHLFITRICVRFLRYIITRALVHLLQRMINALLRIAFQLATNQIFNCSTFRDFLRNFECVSASCYCVYLSLNTSAGVSYQKFTLTRWSSASGFWGDVTQKQQLLWRF